MTACPSALLCPGEQQLEGIPLCARGEGQPRGRIPSPGAPLAPRTVANLTAMGTQAT